MEEQIPGMAAQAETELNTSPSAEEKYDIFCQQREYVDDLFQNHRYVWSLLLLGDGPGTINHEF